MAVPLSLWGGHITSSPPLGNFELRSDSSILAVTSHSAKGASPLLPDDLKAASHHTLASPSERRGTRTAQSTPMHSRESSAVRGRAADPSTLAPTLQARRGHSGSKSPDVSTGRPAGYDVGLERRPSNSYGHHRQTSIVHGMQHSRNPSMAGSNASASPLSPELIASLGRGGAFDEPGLPSKLDQLDAHVNYPSPPVAPTSHGPPGTLSTIQDNDIDDVMNGSPISVVHKRMNSGGVSRRDRSHSRSHSKHSESKTVGEYALHHLFNSVRERERQTDRDRDHLIGNRDEPRLTGNPSNSLLVKPTGRSTRQS